MTELKICGKIDLFWNEPSRESSSAWQFILMKNRLCSFRGTKVTDVSSNSEDNFIHGAHGSDIKNNNDPPEK